MNRRTAKNATTKRRIAKNAATTDCDMQLTSTMRELLVYVSAFTFHNDGKWQSYLIIFASDG